MLITFKVNFPCRTREGGQFPGGERGFPELEELLSDVTGSVWPSRVAPPSWIVKILRAGWGGADAGIGLRQPQCGEKRAEVRSLALVLALT